MEIDDEMRKIVHALGSIRVSAAPEEYDIHIMVEDALKCAGISAQHEAKLGQGCRIDFLCGQVGIEIKKNRPPRAALLKQVSRYAASDCIGGLIMVAPGDLRLPAHVRGVPVRCVALSRLWGVALP